MCEVKSILEKHKIQECSFENKFEIHHNNPIDALSFVMGFFNMLVQGKNTVECWAGEIYKLTDNAISAQAVQGKLQFRHVDFAREYLKKILRNIVLGNELIEAEHSVLNKFNRVFIEDSTCLALPDEMFDFFPGTVNQNGQTSTARVQLRMELKSGNYTNCELKSYRNNDQSYSGEILSELRKDDLVIRDLGYWSLKVFRKIIKKGTKIISKHQFQTYIFTPETEQKIELFKELRSLRRKGISLLDINVLVGAEEKLPMRLIAIKAPESIKRNRLAKMRKDKLKKRSDDYLEMLGWTIYLTNISKEKVDYIEIHKLYGFRWRIEIMFKCWKSKFNLYFFFSKKRNINPPRVYITFYLVLIWLSLFFVRKYNYYLIEVYKRKNKILSLFKFADFIKMGYSSLLDESLFEKRINYLARYCCQQKRRIKSSVEIIYLLNFN